MARRSRRPRPRATRRCAARSIASSESDATKTRPTSRWSSRAPRGPIATLAEKLEEIARQAEGPRSALGRARPSGQELTGAERATELVRQAEVLVRAGVDPVEAQQHGESGLGSVPPAQVEPLLARLAALTEAPGPIIDVYERQVGRCKVPADRLGALARAAQVAAEQRRPRPRRSFYELALGGGVPEETLLALELSATQGDREQGGTVLRATLAEALVGRRAGLARRRPHPRACSCAAPRRSPTAISATSTRPSAGWATRSSRTSTRRRSTRSRSWPLRSTICSAPKRRSGARSQRCSTARSFASSSARRVKLRREKLGDPRPAPPTI